MKMHERFRFKNKDELFLKAKDLGFELPFSEDITPLTGSKTVGDYKVNNRMVVQPMEGQDSEYDGSPSGLTGRRYIRFAEGGSGIIWFEAVSVSPDGRSNPRQMWIHKKNSDKFSFLNEEIKKHANRQGFDPMLVIQLTHSGRYSNPEGKPSPKVACMNPLLDSGTPYLLTDDDLKRIQDQFAAASRLAARSGFNAIDIKACHGYLVVELLAAKNRQDSLFGGEEMERRFRFLLETYDRLKDENRGITITTRLNISDLYTGGFGVDEKGEPDFTEPLELVGELQRRGIELINISMGSPYYNPHVTRPFDNPLPGKKVPEEHPFEGVMRMINGTALFQKRFSGIAFVGSGYSWLRHFAPHVGAALINKGDVSFIGFGRNSFAYPSMPSDIIKKGTTDPSGFCITCSGCTRLTRNFRPGGCVIHDREIYRAELKKLIADGH
jgi:2,4-dienoyl-CoA reductase-like NADH-dependent reductase (Old Yellow Enzyme family)